MPGPSYPGLPKNVVWNMHGIKHVYTMYIHGISAWWYTRNIHVYTWYIRCGYTMYIHVYSWYIGTAGYTMYIHGIYMNIQPISVRSRYHWYHDVTHADNMQYMQKICKICINDSMLNMQKNIQKNMHPICTHRGAKWCKLFRKVYQVYNVYIRGYQTAEKVYITAE